MRRPRSDMLLPRARRGLHGVLAQRFVSRAVTSAIRPVAGLLSARTLLRFPVVRTVEVSSPYCDGPVYLDAGGVDPIASMIFWRGLAGWEPETLPVFLRLIGPGATVIDVGANTGLFSLLAGRRPGGVRVHAIEPVPRVFDLLEANMARNRASNVTCHRLALADGEGPAELYVPDQEMPVTASMIAGWHTGSRPIEVEGRTLDHFVETLGTDRVDMVKIDTEGTEPAVLRGARRTLATLQPFVICEVLAVSRTADEVTAIMGEAGYRIFLLGEDGPRATSRVHGAEGEPESCRNYLFVPPSRWQEASELIGQ